MQAKNAGLENAGLSKAALCTIKGDACLLAPRSGVALVPCGHARFCTACAETVTALGNGCPLCRSPIQMTLKLYTTELSNNYEHY